MDSFIEKIASPLVNHDTESEAQTATYRQSGTERSQPGTSRDVLNTDASRSSDGHLEAIQPDDTRIHRRKRRTKLPNLWESEFSGPKQGLRLSQWPFSRYKAMQPIDTVTHAEVKYCHLPLYNHAVCVYLRPWALLLNSLPVGVTLNSDAALDPKSGPRKSDSTSNFSRDSSNPESSVLCYLDPNSMLAPPPLDSSFWICLQLKGRGYDLKAQHVDSQRSDVKGQDVELKGHDVKLKEQCKGQDAKLKGPSYVSTCSIELRSNQMYYTPKVSGLLYPNSFVYVDVFCDQWVSEQ